MKILVLAASLALSITTLPLLAAESAAPAAAPAAKSTPAPAAAPAASAAKPLTKQQQKMKDCNAEAKTKAMKGPERQDFMKKCLSGK